MFFLLIFLIFLEKVQSDCCYSTQISFTVYNLNDTCGIYGGTGDVYESCSIRVCGDGMPHKGYYCGLGSCNIFGCNCDLGCISGNAVENFQLQNEVRVGNVYSGSSDDYRKFHYEAMLCTTFFEHRNYRGTEQVLCGKRNECVNLPVKWRNRISSVNGEAIIVYADLNCDGVSMKIDPYGSCKDDFSSDSFWNPCKRKDMNDRIKSFRFISL